MPTSLESFGDAPPVEEDYQVEPFSEEGDKEILDEDLGDEIEE